MTDAAAPGAPKDPNAGVNKTAEQVARPGQRRVDRHDRQEHEEHRHPDGCHERRQAISVAGAVTINIVTTVSKAWLADSLVITATDGPVTWAARPTRM